MLAEGSVSISLVARSAAVHIWQVECNKACMLTPVPDILLFMKLPVNTSPSVQTYLPWP